MQKIIFQRKCEITLLLALLLFVLQFVFTGCAINQYPKFVRDATLTHQFESSQVLLDYKYYYFGPTFEPDVILGVHRDYEMEKGLWKEVDLTSNHLYRWIRQLKSNDGSDFRLGRYASYIVDEDGRHLGIWYSMEQWTTVKRGEGNKINIYPPNSIQSTGTFFEDITSN